MVEKSKLNPDMPKELKKTQEQLMSQDLALKDRLACALQMLQELKYVSKEKPLELKIVLGKGKGGVVSKLDNVKFNILMEFLQDIYHNLVQPKLHTNSKLFDGLLSRSECLHQLTLIVSVCYAKLATQLQCALNRDEKTTQFIEVTTLLTHTWQDPEYKVPLGVVELVLFETENMLKDYQDLELSRSTLLQGQETKIEQFCLRNTLILSSLAQCFTVYKSYDTEAVAQAQVKILSILHSIARKINYQSLVELQDFADRVQTPQGFVFLSLLEEMHLGSAYTETCILNVLLLVSNKFVLRFNNTRVSLTAQLSDLVEKLESRLLVFLDEITQSQIHLYQTLTRQRDIDDCKDVVLDAQWISDLQPQQNATCDLNNVDQQNNWLRVNRALYNLAGDVMPRYYLKKDNSLQLGLSNSLLSHHCDLLRVQIHFIMNLELSQPFLLQFGNRLSVIPEHLGYDCKLVLTMQKMFGIFFKQNFNPDFNKEILRQIYATFKLVAAGVYSRVDKLQYLKVLFLLFMAVKLEGLDVCVVLAEKEQTQFAKILLQLFSADYYSDKYLRLFEEIYDLDSLADVLNLQDIVGKLEQKNKDTALQTEGVHFVNKVLQQHLAITVLVQIASRSEPFFQLVLQFLTEEIDKNGMQQCDKEGTIYVERVQTFQDPISQQSYSIEEFLIRKQGAFTSQMYQCLKLCLALFFNNNQPKTYFDILISSEAHYKTSHKSTDPHCDDCLKRTIKKLKLQNKAISLQPITILFKLLLQRIRSLAASLDAQEQSQQKHVSLDTLKQLLTLDQQALRVKLNQLRQQYSDRFLTSSKRIENSTLGYKIVEKVSTMLTRFLLFCSQDPALASALVSATQSESTAALGDLPNLEFRLLMLRNLLLRTYGSGETNSLTEQLYNTMRQINKHFGAFKEQAAKFQLLQQKLNSNYTTNRQRSNSNLFAIDYETLFTNMRNKYRRLADVAVSIVGLYPLVVVKQDSLHLFENSEFQKTVLLQIQIFVTDERSALANLIQASLAIFLFQTQETANPLQYDDKSSITLQTANDNSFANSLCLVYERYFDFLLSTVINYINIVGESYPHISNIVSPEPTLFDPVVPSPQEITLLLQTIKQMVLKINNAIVVQCGDTVHEKVTADLLKLRCALTTQSLTHLKKVFIFVAEQAEGNEDCGEILKLLSQMLVRVFNVPKASQMRDFFAFLREIVYYNQQMDFVDVRLLQELLTTWLQSMELKQRSQISHRRHTKWNAQLDHFVFSTITPGLMLLNSVECQKELQVVVMFRFSQHDMLQQPHQTMVVFSLLDRSEETSNIAGQQERLGLDVELIVDYQKKYFFVQDTRKHQVDTQPFKPIPIQNKWYTLIVRLNRFSRRILEAANLVSAEIYIDKISNESRIHYGDYKSDHRAKFCLALGSSVDSCLGNVKNNKIFQGRCSIPLFCVGIPDCRSIEAEPARALVMELQEMINNKQMLNQKGLEVETSGKKLKFADFHSVDYLTSKAVIAHQVIYQLGFLTAVHHRKTSEVMVGIGGFKNMFPLVRQILKSNLLSLGRTIPGHILSRVFKILGSFLTWEPAHVESHFFRNNLIEILKFWIIKAGENQMMTSELLQEIQNIVRNCVLVQMMQVGREQKGVLENMEQSIQNYRHFYCAFLQDYVHFIMLDPLVLALNCYSSTQKQDHDDASSTLVFNEQVAFLHRIFCPARSSAHLEQREFSDSASSHSDPAARVLLLTDYQLLRDTVVKQETVPLLLELVNRMPFCQIKNLSLLSQLGEAIHASILYLDDKESFHKIVRATFVENKALLPETLFVYLRVILQLITDEGFKKKKNLLKVLDTREFQPERLAVILFQFETPLARSLLPDETLALQDSIISLVLQVLVQHYINRRSKLRTIPFSDRVAAVDDSKRILIKSITDALNQNSGLLSQTYITLMLMAFGKTKSDVITIDALTRQIHQCVVWQEHRGSHEVFDFDIDFFFLALSLLNKFPAQTQVLFLSNLLLFFSQNYQKFMQVFQAQQDEVGLNPYNERLKEFYYKVALLLLKNENAQTSALAQQLLVDVCFFQLTKSNDELQNAELTERDDWGLWLFRRIYSFLDSSLTTQLLTLQHILRRILDEINQRGRIFKQYESVKLNLKLLHLVQFIEEVYVAKHNLLANSNLFQETLVALMFLFEQVGLLNFDLPDRVSSELDDVKATRLKPAPLKVKKNLNLKQQPADLLMSVDEPFQHNFKAIQTPSKNSEPDMADINWHIVSEKVRASQNFISGGPARVFLHMLLNLLVKHTRSPTAFNSVLAMLRYLLLRERGPYIQTTVSKVLGYSCHPVQIYSIFSRPNYLNDKKQTSDNQPESPLLGRADHRLIQMAAQPTVKFVACEMKIYRETLKGVLATINLRQLRAGEENFEGKEDVGREVPSERDQKIAYLNYSELEQSNKIGFTATRGFVAIQLIAETVEIIGEVFDEDMRTMSLTKTLNQPQNITVLTQLLRLLYDCLASEFFEGSILCSRDEGSFEKIKSFNFFGKVIETLISFENQETSSLRKSISFWSQFLEQPLQDLLALNNISTEINMEQNGYKYQLQPQKSRFHEENKEIYKLTRQITQNPQAKDKLDLLQLKSGRSTGQIEIEMNFGLEPESPSSMSVASEIFESTEDRQSWVESVNQSELSQSSQPSRLQPTASEDLQSQYSTQTVDFVRKLFLALDQLQESPLNDQEVIQPVLLKIVKQVLCKEKQRRICLAFGQATSHLFAYELLQVKMNSDARFQQIKSEITKLQKEVNLFDQAEQRRIAVGNFNKYVDNQLMQSQQYLPSKLLSESQNSILRTPEYSGSKVKSTKLNQKMTNLSRSSSDLPLGDDFKSTMQYQHTKYLFKKIVKRLYEDESSFWYDQVEEAQQDFKEIKEVYDAIQSLRFEDPKIVTADSKLAKVKQQLGNLDLERQNNNVVKDIERILDYARLVENPKQKCYFQSQRRTMDSWGRMLLLKPNRKALDYFTWLYYDYFVEDYLNKLFAVSLLNDDNFYDLVKPVALKSGVSVNKLLSLSNRQLSSIDEQPDQSESESSQDVSFEQPQEEVLTTAYSVFLQKKRQELLQRQNTHKLMKRYILTPIQALKQRGPLPDADLVARRSLKIQNIHKKEKDSKLFECQSVRVNGTFWGWLLLTKEYLYYLSACCKTPSAKERPDLSFVDSSPHQANLKAIELIVKWENIDEVMKRKLVNQFQGVDLVTFHKKCYTFNLLSEQKVNEFLTVVRAALQEKRDESSYRIITDPRSVFLSPVTPEFQFLTEWKNGQRSNMEMLMLVNKFSSRSFNDLSQYYIFPWVLSDYHSQAHVFYERLKKNECFRDFGCHLGIISEKKKKQSLDEFEDSSDPNATYVTGTYGKGGFHLKFGLSNSMSVAQWLCRLEPWSSLNFISSDYKRDPRVPIDFHHSFQAVLVDKQAFSELLPEHFYLPEVLMNLNKLSLGMQSHKEIEYQLDAMMLPPWAMNYHDFVRIMREALESKHVSKNIGNWVDLTFGVLQKSLDKHNQYFACAYEDFWVKDRLVTPEEALRLKLSEEEYANQDHKHLILDYYTVPSKVFDKPLLYQAESTLKSELSEKDMELKTNITMLIKAFVENQKSKKKSFLGQIAVHNYLDPQTDIVHMLFNNEKKCLVFVRLEDSHDRRADTGNLVMYLCQETLSKDSFTSKPFDLQMRYEWVAEDLNNVFAIYSFPANRLYVCGYLDNSVRIFDLEAKPGPPIRVLTNSHSARVTCIKFTQDYKYLYTCDTDGVIMHYQFSHKPKETKQEAFPYRRLHKLQDQTDEILAIDCNQTLDMYVTLSRDGTVAVRCQRTSKLWYNFRIFSKIFKNGKEYIYQTFHKILTKVTALKLSLHGYIVIVGKPEQSSFTKYLVYNLAGDVLLSDLQEKSSVKGVFLNATEDQLIIAHNYLEKSKEPPQLLGNLRVVKLYGLEKLANLSQIVYSEARQQIQAQKQPKLDQQTKKPLPKQISTPVIQVIAMKKSEASLNIFFTNYDHTPPTKEIICFELSKLPVWTQLADMALAPRTRAE